MIVFDRALAWFIPVLIVAFVSLVGRRYLRFWWAPLVAIAALYGYYAYRNSAYDYNIYYWAARGELFVPDGECIGPIPINADGEKSEGFYVYSSKTTWLFKPLTWGNRAVSFAAYYAVLLAAYIGIINVCFRHFGRYPVACFAAAVATGAGLHSTLHYGNVAALLAFACLTPLGTLLAMCIKPYLGVFLLLHAAVYCARHNAPKPAGVHPVEGEPALRTGCSEHPGGIES
jgi:hypothetical protein